MNQDYSMTVANSQNPDNFLKLTCRSGQHSVLFSVNCDGHSNDFVVTSKDDLTKIAEFLQQRSDDEETPPVNTPTYIATGIGLCILDHSGKVLETYYGQSGKGIVG